MGRTISSGVLARSQADIFNPAGSETRQSGIVPSGLTLSLFVNNSLIPWTLQDGSSVPDSSVSAGYIYFNEIAGAPGFYSVRFFPDRVGFWRMVLKVGMTSAEVITEFDVVPATISNANGGLNASFMKP
jgi:hypothetical protein